MPSASHGQIDMKSQVAVRYSRTPRRFFEWSVTGRRLLNSESILAIRRRTAAHPESGDFRRLARRTIRQWNRP